MYHYVDQTPPDAGPYSVGLTVLTPEFKAQMDYLARNGYHPVTLERVYAAMTGLEKLPSKPVAITFDDGGKDNFTVAYPILQAHHFVATFFVITGYVGHPGSMSWEDLRTMQVYGMAIESHTVTHKDLKRANAATLKKELVDSRQAIFQELGRQSLVLCYPGGLFDQEAMGAARVAGYLLAVTTQPGKVLYPSKVYQWPRVRVSHSESLHQFAASLQ